MRADEAVLQQVYASCLCSSPATPQYAYMLKAHVRRSGVLQQFHEYSRFVAATQAADEIQLYAHYRHQCFNLEQGQLDRWTW